MSNRLKKKVALVTGGASGIGRATVELFAEEGAHVIIADRDEDQGQRVAGDIGRATFMSLDVTSEDGWKSVITKVEEQYSQLNILVNNAGIYVERSITTTSIEEWRKCISINLDSVFLGTKYAIALMQKSVGSSIINVSSAYGLIGNAGSSALCASKGGVVLFTKAAALEFATLSQPVRVNSICPGFVQTPLWEKEMGDQHQIDWEAILSNKTAMNRPATAREIAKGILFLASDDSSYMTGSELVIDGGYTSM